MIGWRQKFRQRHALDIIQESDRNKAESIINRFKKQHPALMELNPEIGIHQFLVDSDSNPCNLLILYVGHEFIFDYRLIPSYFENIEVKSHLMENMPKEFPLPCPGMLNEVYHSPDRYVLFVEKNIEKIRKSLKSKNMTVNEALNALTGDFEKHKSWILQLKKEKIMENKEHIDFFNKLLKKTEHAFLKSDVYKNHKQKNWGYSVTATSFKKNDKVIIGFNWGAEKGESYGAQQSYPLKNFPSLYDELGSFKRTFNWFHKYFEEMPYVQTNYCFFRSETENQITPDDLKLSSKLFDELIEYLEPTMLITFSRSLNEYLEKTDKLTNIKPLEIKSGNKTVYASKGYVKISNQEIEYFNLPHPNYPITRDAREKAWNFCFQ